MLLVNLGSRLIKTAVGRSGEDFLCRLSLPVCPPGPFRYSTGNVSGRYETEITPAGWTFSIWGVIYTWLLLMVLYQTTYLFRG